MLTACDHCPNWRACKKYGCYAWNDAARKKIQAEPAPQQGDKE